MRHSLRSSGDRFRGRGPASHISSAGGRGGPVNPKEVISAAGGGGVKKRCYVCVLVASDGAHRVMEGGLLDSFVTHLKALVHHPTTQMCPPEPRLSGRST
jgi:hypothetical protein